ncbi:MAG: hypothetical protein ACKOFX_01055 [Solirubrobacterales bacterium]
MRTAMLGARRMGTAALFAMGLVVGSSIGPVGGATANPATPIIVDEASGIIRPAPSISPTGEQIVSYLRRTEGGLPLPGLVARTGGAPFSPFEELSTIPALDPPVVGFGSRGTALVGWYSAAGTEQTIRASGGPVEGVSQVGACTGPVAIAVSGADRTLAACRAGSGTSPAWSGAVGLGQMSSRISLTTQVTPDSSNPSVTPLSAWGADGTGVAAFGYTPQASPSEQRIEARVYGPGGSFTETEDVGSATAPSTLEPTGLAVLPSGIVAITADSNDGAVLFTRAAGAGSSFTQTELAEDTASMPAADQWGRLHFLTSITGGPTGTTWWVRVRDPDGSLRPPIPIPTEDTGAVPVENGLQVFPNGAEAIVTRSDTGFYIAFRRPGAGAFSVPRRLAGTTNTSGGAASRTAQGDILLTLAREVTPGRQQLVVGGWDSGTLPVITRLSMPKQMRRGATGRFSVTATDAMGVGRITWQFPGNRRLEGASVRARLTKPGVNRVKVTVFDQAGFRSIRIRRVKVAVPGGPKVQGLAGTSGSPSP